MPSLIADRLKVKWWRYPGYKKIFADKVLEQVHIDIVSTVTLVVYTSGGLISTLNSR